MFEYVRCWKKNVDQASGTFRDESEGQNVFQANQMLPVANINELLIIITQTIRFIVIQKQSLSFAVRYDKLHELNSIRKSFRIIFRYLVFGVYEFVISSELNFKQAIRENSLTNEIFKNWCSLFQFVWCENGCFRSNDAKDPILQSIFQANSTGNSFFGQTNFVVNLWTVLKFNESWKTPKKPPDPFKIKASYNREKYRIDMHKGPISIHRTCGFAVRGFHCFASIDN